MNWRKVKKEVLRVRTVRTQENLVKKTQAKVREVKMTLKTTTMKKGKGRLSKRYQVKKRL